MKNLLVGQSGGPTAVINSSLAGVFLGAKNCNIDNVYGMRYGISGFMDGKYVNLSDYIKSEEDIELLKRTPSAFLGSCRRKLPPADTNPAVYEQIFTKLDELDIKYFLYIGGNDSMDTIDKLSAYGRSVGSDIAFVGVPKTIDNDLISTDHTPGFASAAKFVASAIKEIRLDATVYNIPSVTIVEIMGRDAGWLTASVALAKDGNSRGADLIYLPELPFDMTDFLARIKELTAERGSIVVAVSEGLRTEAGEYICNMKSSFSPSDAFGHGSLGGTANYLSGFVSSMLGIKSRGIELSTLQRCSAHMLSARDMEEAFEIGKEATRLCFEGESGVMVVAKRLPDKPYNIVLDAVKISTVANKVKNVPKEWILPQGQVDETAIREYMLPLIDGEYTPILKNGLPQHLLIKD